MRIVEDKFDFMVLARDGVIGANGEACKRAFVASPNSYSDDCIIDEIGYSGNSQDE